MSPQKLRDVHPQDTAVTEFTLERTDDPLAPAFEERPVKAKPDALVLDIGSGNARALGVLEREVALCAISRHQLHEREHDQ